MEELIKNVILKYTMIKIEKIKLVAGRKSPKDECFREDKTPWITKIDKRPIPAMTILKPEKAIKSPPVRKL